MLLKTLVRCLSRPAKSETGLREALKSAALKSLVLMVPVVIGLTYFAGLNNIADIEMVPPSNPGDELVLKLQTLYEANNCAGSPWADGGVPYPTKIVYYTADISGAKIGEGGLIEDAIAQEYGGEDRNITVLAWCP